jgi:proteic killer suppression protein
MDITFEKEYLRELYETGKTTDKKYRFQPDIVKKYQARIRILEKSSKIEDLYTLNSLHYEVLKGDKKGISSIRVNDQYRIEFITTQVAYETVITICNILELSNHYK